MLSVREFWEIPGMSFPSSPQELGTPEKLVTLLLSEQATRHLPLCFPDLSPASPFLHLGPCPHVGIF